MPCQKIVSENIDALLEIIPECVDKLCISTGTASGSLGKLIESEFCFAAYSKTIEYSITIRCNPEKISKIFSAIALSRSITELQLCVRSAHITQFIIDMLSSNNSIKALSITKMPFEVELHDALLDCISSKHYESITFAQLTLYYADMTKFCENILQFNPSLQSLVIRECSPEQVTELVKMISKLEFLTNLDLSENNFGPVLMTEIATILSSKSLRHINLRNNLGDSYFYNKDANRQCRECIDAFAEAIEDNYTVTTLNMNTADRRILDCINRNVKLLETKRYKSVKPIFH